MTWSEATTPTTSHSDDAPPSGTAIVRPLRHVRAVRERHMLRFATPADAAASRSARAWAWAIGETRLSPVTDQLTSVPPDRDQIHAEITAADDRRLNGSREDRADAAATILRWIIGADDHVPIRCDNPGELIGGFGDIVRSKEQILALIEKADESRQVTAVLTGCPGYPRTLCPRTVRFAITCDNFSPHLATARDSRVGDRAAASNAEIAYTSSDASC